MQRYEQQVVAGGIVNKGILRNVAQEELISGAQSITVRKSLITFSDPGSPSASNITLSTSGHAIGDILYVVSLSASDTDVVLLAASLVGASPITLASGDDYTVLMFTGSGWLNIGGTAPA